MQTKAKKRISTNDCPQDNPGDQKEGKQTERKWVRFSPGIEHVEAPAQVRIT